MKSILFLMTLALMSNAAIHAQTVDSLKYTVVTANEFQKGFEGNSNAVLIDSRDYKDYRKSRIPGAVNIIWPIPEKYFSGPEAPSKDKPLFIYCYAGNRSKKVSVIFYDHGYRNIYSLKGGFNGWRMSRMAVDRKRLKSG
jgi:rhodanese-related sulfurtransferase